MPMKKTGFPKSNMKWAALAVGIPCLAVLLYWIYTGAQTPPNSSQEVNSTVMTSTKNRVLPTLTVDMFTKTGPLKHGAAGFLYGMGEDGVPSVNLLTPIKPKIAVQKAPDGMQHPNGDALKVAETFIEAGGEQVQIYMQDFYAIWPYEFTNIDDYLEIVKGIIPKVKSSPYADKMVYVPFNEPDWIWYEGLGNKSSVQQRFMEDWLKVYRAIKSLHPQARIAGTGCAGYQPDFLEAFIPFCVENNCMPDIVTWHELQSDKLITFAGHYEHYRELEKANGLREHEIVINEYAPQDHCSVPGKLVNWIATFEDKKVSACLPYWHISNNLNDIAADNNEPNGAWWLYKWYGDMSGQTLKLTQSNTDRDELYGLASINEDKRSASVIFGGTDKTCRIRLDNIDKTQAFKGDRVNIKLEATWWTAYHGTAQEPVLVLEGIYEVKQGAVEIELNSMEMSAAYRITITQAASDEPVGIRNTGSWRKTYEAENAEFLGNAGIKIKPDKRYAYSNNKQVSYIRSPGDGVKWSVDVPEDGYYRLDLFYANGVGNDTADPARNNPETV